MIPILRENSHAKNILELNIDEEKKLKNINNYIIKEVENIICKGVGLESDRNKLENELQEILDRWVDRVEESENIRYQDKDYNNSILTTKIDDTECFFTLNSMRNVDAQSNIYVEGL